MQKIAERHGFKIATKRELAERVAFRCSKPDCRAPTHGPVEDETGSSNVGVASHIHAASPGGPRYLAEQSEEERTASTNGIWLCAICGKKIDDDETSYPADLLRAWKVMAEHSAKQEQGKPVSVEARGPIPAAKLSYRSTRAQNQNPLSPSVHSYQLFALLTNVGKIRIDDWLLEVDVPKAFSEVGILQGWVIGALSQGKHLHLERKSRAKEEPFLANRVMTLPVLCTVSTHFVAERPYLLDLPVVIRAHVDGVLINELRFPARELFEARDLPNGAAK